MSWNDSSCRPGHNPPLPLGRPPPGSFKRLLGRWLSRVKQFLNGEANVAGDLTKESRGDVAPCVNRNGRDATISMPELFVGAALPDLPKAEVLQDGHHLARLEDRWLSH